MPQGRRHVLSVCILAPIPHSRPIGMHDMRDGRERHAWLSGGGPMVALQQNRGLHNQCYGLGGEGGEIGERSLRAVCMPAASVCRPVSRAPPVRISVKQPAHENDFRVPRAPCVRLLISSFSLRHYRWPVQQTVSVGGCCGVHVDTHASINGVFFYRTADSVMLLAYRRILYKGHWRSFPPT